jgi:hypothetical protein
MENASHNAMHQHRHEGDEYRWIELITGVVRRRRWTAAEKAALVAESLQPGINVCGSRFSLTQQSSTVGKAPAVFPTISLPTKSPLQNARFGGYTAFVNWPFIRNQIS